MDFGYGTVGHLKLLGLLGADVVGVEVDPMLRALYAGDQGKVGKAGHLTLVDGQWPGGPGIAQAAGGGFDLILSKNTLKRGYIHPEREVNPRMLVHLGVDDSTFVAAMYRALKPGGHVLIYNLSPAPSKPDQPYLPWSDGRCPFDRGLLERAGFEVIAYDFDDGVEARKLGHALGWDAGPRPMDLANDLFAHATLLRKKA
jgi:SAM-dependent methyltransferase